MSNQSYRSFSAESLSRILPSLCCLETINYAPGALDRCGGAHRPEPSEHGGVIPMRLKSRRGKVGTSVGVSVGNVCETGPPKRLQQEASDSRDTPRNRCQRILPVPRRRKQNPIHTVRNCGVLAGSRTAGTHHRDRRPSGWRTHVDSLLLMAATAALRMPPLKTTEIWALRIDYRFVFCYHAGEYGPTAYVCATWSVKLGAAVLDA
ncbi:hypothetical protein CSHISOI_10671 [Colletotrichum shisoi]|uniref:DUF6546 domain-containing protein n=1 Tax=Colletotrichum shisoi TaxID=2078593 RepID=A0A5Q4BCY2_9PEZI|nr:hypothetical protein CSHISOI_10671 [Colletotrichum shisoi]